MSREGAGSPELRISTMKVSVVIPTYNRLRVLARTLPTVLDQDFPADNWEVVVVVDGSTDGTAEYLRRICAPCPLRVVEQANAGSSAARNVGAAAARGEILLYIDDDDRCPRDLVSAHVRAHGSGSRRVVFGPIRVAPESPRNLATDWIKEWTAEYVDELLSNGGPRSRYKVWITPNYSLPRELFLEIGGYDERLTFPGSEDTDFTLRLFEAGCEIAFAPEAGVYQLYSKTPEQLVRVDSPKLGAAEVEVCRKHRDYRPHSRLAGLAEGGPLRRAMMYAAARAPFSPQALLWPACMAGERWRSSAAVNRAGLRAFKWRLGIEFLRGGIRSSGGWNVFRHEFATRLRVLSYGDVAPEGEGGAGSVPVGEFGRQIEWIRRGRYRPIRLGEWISWREGRSDLPLNPVAITFERPTKTILKYALAVLRRHNCPAVIFADPVDLDARPERLISADEMRRMPDGLIEFGLAAPRLPDPKRVGGLELQRELAALRQRLEAAVARPVKFLAWPPGEPAPELGEAAARLFALAFADEQGLNSLHTASYAHRRLCVLPGLGAVGFAARLRMGIGFGARAKVARVASAVGDGATAMGAQE